MHTETLFISDEAFHAFTNDHFTKIIEPEIPPTPYGKIWSLSEPNSHLYMFYTVREEEDRLHITDCLPLVFPLGRESLVFEISKGPEPQGLRTYLTLRHPMLHNDLTAINCLGWLDSPLSDDKPITTKASLCGLVLYLEPYLKGTYHINEDTPSVQFQRLLGQKPANTFEFRFARALNSRDDHAAPEVHEFITRIESIVSFHWFGITCYRLSVRTLGRDEFSIPYELIASEAVLNGYIPRIGDTINGTAFLYANFFEEKETDHEAFHEFTQLQKQTAREEPLSFESPEEEIPPAETRTFPWGTVYYNEQGTPIGMEANDDYPSVTHQQDSPFFKLNTLEPGVAHSHFRSARLPRFRFYDEFAATLPPDLEVCERPRESVIAYIDQVKVGKKAVFSSNKETIGLLQAAYSPSTGKTLLRFNISPYRNFLPADLILLIDETKQVLIAYTIGYDTDLPFPLVLKIRIHIKGKTKDLGKPQELWKILPKFTPDDFAILVNDNRNTFVQFIKRNNGLYIFEHQQAGTRYQFTSEDIPEDQIRPACEDFFNDDLLLYSRFNWKYAVIK